jgi:hypothetical protein
MAEKFTIEDLQGDMLVSQVLENVQKQFVILDGYYELTNIGRENPISREEFVNICLNQRKNG